MLAEKMTDRIAGILYRICRRSKTLAISNKSGLFSAERWKTVEQRLQSYSSAFMRDESARFSGEFQSFSGKIHRNYLMQLRKQQNPKAIEIKNSFSTRIGQGDEMAQMHLLVLIATAESLGELTNFVSIVKKYCDSALSQKQALDVFSATLVHLANSYFMRQKIAGGRAHLMKSGKLMSNDRSVKHGHFKDILDVAGHYMHDSMVHRLMTFTQWLNHFELLLMGSPDEHVGHVMFDMWTNSFSSWLHSRSEREAYNEANASSAYLNAIAIRMIKWCKKNQSYYHTNEIKRIANIWSIFVKARDFAPDMYVIRTLCDDIEDPSGSSGLLEHVFDTARSVFLLGSIMRAPWNVTSRIIAALPAEKAVALTMLRHRIESRGSSVQNFNATVHLPYHLLRSLMLVYIRNRCIAEAEHLFRAHVSPNAKVLPTDEKYRASTTLQRALSTCPSDPRVQREHLILLMLRAYAYLPVPELQGALDLLSTYIGEGNYTADHYYLLLRAAADDQCAANAIYVEACSNGIQLDRRAYSAMYFAFGKASRWATRGANLADMGIQT